MNVVCSINFPRSVLNPNFGSHLNISDAMACSLLIYIGLYMLSIKFSVQYILEYHALMFDGMKNNVICGWLLVAIYIYIYIVFPYLVAV
jgi:hypothetical protein